MTNSIANRRWRLQIKRGKYICCHICKFPIMLSGTPGLGHLTTDHYQPLALGGTQELKNLKPAHAKCNHFKGATPPKEYVFTEKHLKYINKMRAKMCPEAAI